MMDWPAYKRLCDRPDVWSRWMLEQSAALVRDAALFERIRAHTGNASLEKPADHRGGAPTDMFQLDLTLAEVARILAAIEEARARGVTTTATSRRGLGGFVEAWSEYHRFLAGAQAARTTGG
jgi:hypothetical protein